MPSKICTLSSLRIRVTMGGELWEYECDPKGVELGEGRQIRQQSHSSREYVCTNCGEVFDGAEIFDEARTHLGKIHVTIDPFN